MHLQTVMTVRAAKGSGQDRAIVQRKLGAVIIAVADGAGGTGGGAEAAEAVIRAVEVASVDTPWAGLLAELDGDPRRLGMGETTAVIACVTERGIVGASVGDSGAWVVRGAAIEDLTENQQRKPLVGAGCTPMPFASGPLGTGTLVVGSDGLFKYVRRDAILSAIAAATTSTELSVAAAELLEHARRFGEFQDDIAIVLARL